MISSLALWGGVLGYWRFGRHLFSGVSHGSPDADWRLLLRSNMYFTSLVLTRLYSTISLMWSGTFAKFGLIRMLAVHVDELPRVLRLLRLPGPTQLVVLDPLRDATVRPIIVSVESCSAFVGLGHFLEELLPACMGMREAASCLTIPFYVLALLAVGVVMAVLLEVGHVDPELAYDGRLDLVGCPAIRWSLIEARGSLLLPSGSSASRRAAYLG